MYLVVCYDVVEDLRRNRLLKFLKGFLHHVQKSVFEGELQEKDYQSLRDAITGIIDLETDSVRIYHLCGRCILATDILGTGEFVEQEDDLIL